MIRGIELRRPWGSRTSTLHCTYGHATEVPTDAAPSTCPVCDLVSADEANRAKFQDVLTFLRNRVEQK